MSNMMFVLYLTVSFYFSMRQRGLLAVHQGKLALDNVKGAASVGLDVVDRQTLCNLGGESGLVHWASNPFSSRFFAPRSFLPQSASSGHSLYRP
jgi:hypothetical protein